MIRALWARHNDEPAVFPYAAPGVRGRMCSFCEHWVDRSECTVVLCCHRPICDACADAHPYRLPVEAMDVPRCALCTHTPERRYVVPSVLLPRLLLSLGIDYAEAIRRVLDWETSSPLQ